MRSIVILSVAIAGLVPSLAQADDRDAYGGTPPAPNVLFMLDNSGSMQNLSCEDFVQGCFNSPGGGSEMIWVTGPNGSTEMHSPSIDSLGYSSTTTYPYADTDFKKPGDVGYPGGGYLTNFVSNDVYGRTGWPVDATTINAYCTNETNFPNCQQRSRCIYMLTNFGYFWEGNNGVGTGDPMGICPAGTKQNALACATTGGLIGASCTTNSQCGCGICSSGKCQECTTDASCNMASQQCDVDHAGLHRCVNELDPQVMTGNLLNLYPPKLVAARRVMKNVVADYSTTSKIRMRMGMMIYNGNGNGGILQKELGPTCGASCINGSCDTAFETWRNGIVTSINALAFNTGTPLGETLDDMACYYSDSRGPACVLTSPSGVVAVGTGGTTPDPPACTTAPPGAIGANCASNNDCGCGICKKVGSNPKQCQECATDADCTTSGDNCTMGTDGVNHCYGTGISVGGGGGFSSLLNGPPICDACQKNFAVQVTDGIPNGDGPAIAGNPAGSGAGHQPITQSYYGTPTLMMNDDPQHFLLPVTAKNIFSHDLDPTIAGTQNVITYAVSFGVYDPTNPSVCAGELQRAGQNGGGACFLAKNSAQLTAALQSVLQNIGQETQSFTGPALQTSRSQGDNNANLALFRADSSGPLWEGHLFALDLWDESLKGDFSGGSATVHNEIFILGSDGSPITFDSQGNLLSTPYWDAGLCLAGDAANSQPALVPQDPHNINVSQCYKSGDETAGNARKILTSLSGSVGSADPFTMANESAIHAKLGLAAAGGPCASTGTSLACVGQKIIGFFRGLDMLDRKGRGTVVPPLDRNLSNLGQSAGWWKIGDIFHSISAAVPQPYELSSTTFGGTGSSYAKFVQTNANRIRMLIAGANDGMIHAFDSGHWTGAYDHGSGTELWAFVPPHMLPKMAGMLNCPSDQGSPCTVADKYEYFVDGSPQVRDVYTPTNGNLGTLTNLAVATNDINWKTIAITGDRDGGKKYTALDVTDPAAPKFLWEFPTSAQVGTGSGQRAEPAGLSWSDAYPNPAPIMPVTFLDASGNPYLRWVAMVNGGFSRNQTAGRGLYMLDAYTGALLWKYEFKAGATDDRQYMTYSIAAPPGMVSPVSPKVGQPPGAQYVLAVDTGGQVWRFDVSTPQFVAAGSLATWTGKRLFASAASSATSSAYAAQPTSSTILDLPHYPYRPMFQMVSGAWGSTGDLWIMVGTGDRDLLSNPQSPTPAGITLTTDVVKEVCGQSPFDSSTYLNRLYGLDSDKLAGLSSVGTEDNLTNVTSSPGHVTQPTVTKTGGWFLELTAGEKVNNPADVFADAAYFTTFTPPSNCGLVSATQTCSAPVGTGTLYVLNFETGLPILNLTNADAGTTFGTYGGRNGVGAGTISSADASIGLGAGAPSAPNVSFGQQGKNQSGALVVSTSSNSSPIAVSAKTDETAGTLLYQLQVTRSLHDTFLQYGTTH